MAAVRANGIGDNLIVLTDDGIKNGGVESGHGVGQEDRTGGCGDYFDSTRGLSDHIPCTLRVAGPTAASDRMLAIYTTCSERDSSSRLKFHRTTAVQLSRVELQAKSRKEFLFHDVLHHNVITLSGKLAQLSTPTGISTPSQQHAEAARAGRGYEHPPSFSPLLIFGINFGYLPLEQNT